MKKFLLILPLFFVLPTYATCPIDGISPSCTANISSIQTFNTNQQNVLQPKLPTSYQSQKDLTLPKGNLNLQGPQSNFLPEGQNYGYNANCQFGGCNNIGTPQIFNQNRQ